MNPTDQVDALEKLLARVRERRGQKRTRVIVEGAEEAADVSADFVADVAKDAGDGGLETVHLQELEVVEELAPDSRTESVIDSPPTEDDESPVSERRPKSEMPVMEVTLEDLEREAEPVRPGEVLLDGPTMEQMGSTVDLPVGDELSQPLELERPVEDEVAAPSFDGGELEAAIPQGDFAGGWDDSLEAPADAGAELRRLDESKYAYESKYEDSAPKRPPTAPPPPPGELQPDASVGRAPVPAAVPVVTMTGARPSGATSFRELLDASLRLGSR